MAGFGSRFINEGLNVPKYQIIANGNSLLHWSMLSLQDFFDCEFLFVGRKENFEPAFVTDVCQLLGIKKYTFIVLDHPTDGQASTAFMANPYMEEDESCIIYNIDTYIVPLAIKRKDIHKEWDGFIPVTYADGDQWSFVKINAKQEVIEVAEKRKISNLASLGLYYFKHWRLFQAAYLTYPESRRINNEKYVAPMYESLISKHLKVGIKLLDSKNVHILGTPKELAVFDPCYKKRISLP
jgi:dTDP-glucose pyrophosphorylase